MKAKLPAAGPVTVTRADGTVLRTQPAHRSTTAPSGWAGAAPSSWWKLAAPRRVACAACGEIIHPGQTCSRRDMGPHQPEFVCKRCRP